MSRVRWFPAAPSPRVGRWAVLVGVALTAVALPTATGGAAKAGRPTMNIASPPITEFPVTAGSGPRAITAGPDGNLWFTEPGSGSIGRLTPTGTLTEFPAMTPAGGFGPEGIAAGRDGKLWFTEHAWSDIGRMTTAGAVTRFTLAPGCCTEGIAAGPDGRLWFDHNPDGGPGVGRIGTGGAVRENFVAAPGSHHGPFSITAGPDGNLWLADSDSSSIVRIATDGTTPQAFPVSSQPVGITPGPDGNLWFTEPGDQIGRITPTGTVTEFPLPTAFSYPEAITAAADGNLWFTEAGANRIGRITTAGDVSEFPIPGAGTARGIAAGPDGNVWFTEEGGDKIGRISLPGAAEAVLVADFGFTPRLLGVAQGSTVQWTFVGPHVHSVVDASGMGLFDSGPRAAVSYFSLAFVGAGTYTYVDGFSSHTGKVRVPLLVAPASAPVASSFAVTWASGAPPAGFAFDVQIKRPHALGFVGWMTGQTATGTSFTPDAGKGKYTFRARLRNTGNTMASGYSPLASLIAS